MAKLLGAQRIRLNLVDWANAITSPAIVGDGAAIGSYWLRNNSAPATPTEIYLKLTSGNTGWVKQNVVNLKVFNVKSFGAVGNGVTDDSTAIQAAVTAATAAGGGTIYFPPGNFAVLKPAVNLGSITLNNVANLTFLGDGYASRIQMVGDAALGTWYMFFIRNATRCTWANLRLDGPNITNPDPAGQNIGLFFQSQGADAAGPTHCDVVGCYFGRFVGDAIDVQGAAGKPALDIKIASNSFELQDGNATGSRASVLAQRYSQEVSLQWNWVTGAHDNQIDFEPTGGGGDPAAGPLEWSLIGNQIDASKGGVSAAITLSGIGTTQFDTRTRCAFNTITNGGSIQGLNLSNCVVFGNVVTVGGTTATGVCEISRVGQGLVVDSNVFVSLTNTNTRSCIKLLSDSGFEPTRCVVSDNVTATLGDNTGGKGITLEVPRAVVTGNYMDVNVTAVGIGVGIQNSSNAIGDLDHCSVVGNLVVGSGSAMDSGVNFNAVTGSVRNTQANYNFVDNCQAAVKWSRAVAETFLDWRNALLNNLVGAGATATLQLPATNVGSTIEGTAGPGQQTTIINLAAGPEGNITAPKGSLCTDTLGAVSGVIWYKDTAAGVSGGNTGWSRIGASEFSFGALAGSTATANRFFAPGSFGLLVESAVAIQIVIVRPCTLRNFRLLCTPGTGGGTNTYAMIKNAATNVGSIAIANTANNGTNLVNVPTFVPGDTVSWRVTKSVAPTTPQTNIRITFEMTG